MYTLRSRNLLRASRLASRPHPQPTPRRHYATEPTPPTPPSPEPKSKPPSRVGSFYRTFSYPLLKTFLAALFTYQLGYYLWLKLEAVEEKHDKATEIRALKTGLKDAVLEKRARVREAGEKVGEKVDEVKGEGKKKGWWPL